MAPVDDGGLQPERTRLSWRRTTLAAAVVVVLAGREAAHRGLSAAALTGVALAAVVLVVFLAAAQRRMRELGTVRPGELALGAALVVSVCTVALAVLGAVAVV